ncbi:antibiotic biosynthesis monooxygenase [Inquilinus ginsengisoli]|nr:antibiotic biosynthesis monooxygenase [Inquilinus ginsengisoli]
MTAMIEDPVTVIVQTRTRPGQEDAFGRWQARISAAVAEQPGFLEQSVMPPNPPAQPDWVILQRFGTQSGAVAWLRSERRQALVAEAQGLLAGLDDVHLVRDGVRGALPAPASAVIATRVRPGQEAAFRRWEQRIAAAQARAPGFQGYRFEPPVPGVQDDWLAVLRFDSEGSLQAWLESPERHALLNQSTAFTETFHTRIVRTGFDSWFAGNGTRQAPSAWKQNMVVIALLYPVVFLFGAMVQTPILMQYEGLPFWFALFIGNVVSVLLLARLVPWIGRLLAWWLTPGERTGWRRDAVGAGLMVGIYAICLLAFSQF